MTRMLELPDALREAGVIVRTLPGWDEPYRDGYEWRDESGEPVGHMHHHTATTSYVPNREKANGYAGLSFEAGDRLFQEDYGEGEWVPVYVIANAYPAPVSSGRGDRKVIEQVKRGELVTGRPGPDTWDPGTGYFYGNTYWWNTEYILDGIGMGIDEAVWDMMITVCEVQNDLMGWDDANHIAHGHWTGRKIDLWNGDFTDFDKTIIALRSLTKEGRPTMERMPTPNWIRTLRRKDLEQLVDRGVLDPHEADYFWGLIERAKDPEDLLVTWEYSEFQDLRNAYDVRLPLYPAA